MFDYNIMHDVALRRMNTELNTHTHTHAKGAREIGTLNSHTITHARFCSLIPRPPPKLSVTCTTEK